MNNDGFGAIRVSYSTLSAWASGDIDRAVAPYAGKKDLANEISDKLAIKKNEEIKQIVRDIDLETTKDYVIDGKIYRNVPGIVINTAAATAFGKKMHGIWERYVKKHKAIPKIFGGRKLEAPEIELATKRVRKLTDWCVISGVLDVKDGTTGIDWKTGKASATDYTNSKQSEVYQVLYPELKRFEFYCKNQHIHHTDKNHITVGIVYLNRKTLEDGLNWILTMAAELREYLINNGYGNRLDQGKGLE